MTVAALRSAFPSERQLAASEARPALPPVDAAVGDVLRRWLSLSKLERRTFAALCEEVSASSDLIEGGIIDLGRRFQELVVRARDQAAQLEEAIVTADIVRVNGEPPGLGELAEVIDDVLGKIVTLSERAMLMVSALDDAVKAAEEAERTAAELQGIDRQVRLVVLGAWVEAEQAGEIGRTLGVVAPVVQEFSAGIDRLAGTIRERIGAAVAGLHAVRTLARGVATTDMSRHRPARERLDKLMAGLTKRNEETRRRLAQAAAASEEIERTISGLVTGLQFQDRAGQQLAHVIGTLAALGSALAALQETTAAVVPELGWSGQIDEGLARRIADGHTLTRIRDRFIARVLSGERNLAVPTNDTGDEGSIELF